MRSVMGGVLVVVALGSPAAAEDTPPANRPAVLVGGSFGLNALAADLPRPLIEAHAGGGWHTRQWTAAGLVSYAYAVDKSLLSYWSISRHDVELVGLFAYRPMSGQSFEVHGLLGIGAAFDRLHGVDPETSARALSASFGAGVGWGPAALTFRYVIPHPAVCSGPRCFDAPATTQLLLSVTLDLYVLGG